MMYGIRSSMQCRKERLSRCLGCWPWVRSCCWHSGCMCCIQMKIHLLICSHNTSMACMDTYNEDPHYYAQQQKRQRWPSEIHCHSWGMVVVVVVVVGVVGVWRGSARLFHAATRTTSSGCLMLHRTVHALWNLYGNPYKNRAEKEGETVTWWGKS